MAEYERNPVSEHLHDNGVTHSHRGGDTLHIHDGVTDAAYDKALAKKTAPKAEKKSK